VRRWILRLVTTVVLGSLPRATLAQPDLGHKVPGTVGLDAGSQPPPGLYLVDRFLYWDAIHLRDRNGARLPIRGFDIDAIANAVGVAGTFRVHSGLHLGASVAVPFARISTPSADPSAALDRFALGDVFVAPAQIGFRWPRVDVVGSYGFFAPTRQVGRTGLGAPQWAHQISAGTTLYFDDARRGRASILLGYEIHQPKIGIDVTRGDILQIQGGIGSTVLGIVDLGLAGYALWQVRDDRGSDLPAALRGRRDRVFGLGPELGILMPMLRAKLGIRYTRDFGVRGRPEGQLVVVGLSFRVWAQP
jgi:hypothetical protein